MKNAINYYYELYPTNIYQNNQYYKFTINGIDYGLIQFNYEPQQLQFSYDLSLLLKKYNIYCHQIIKNKQNELATNINNKLYVLLKMGKYNDEKLNINSIMYYPLVTINLHLENLTTIKKWRDLWIEKVDYFEYQISNFKKKFPLINRSSNYYIGLAENGIQLLLDLPNSQHFCVSHHRIKNNYTLFDLYNPLEFVIDSKTRDATEYFKTKFFYDMLQLNEITYYIDNMISTNYEAIMFLSRLLYPSYYFDLCDEIIYNNTDENTLSQILVKCDQYELLLHDVNSYLNRNFKIPEIEWLKQG